VRRGALQMIVTATEGFTLDAADVAAVRRRLELALGQLEAR
jgi:hypothetical protein